MTNMIFGGGAGYWEVLHSSTLEVLTTDLDTGEFPARDYMQLMIYGTINGAMDHHIRFNADAGAASYLARYMQLNGTDVIVAAGADGQLGGLGGGQDGVAEIRGEITNFETERKIIRGLTTYVRFLAASTIQGTLSSTVKYIGATAQITRIEILRNAGVGQWEIGTRIVVLGHD